MISLEDFHRCKIKFSDLKNNLIKNFAQKIF